MPAAPRGPKVGSPACSIRTDSIENHVRDTLAAGAGLCDEVAVRTLVEAAPAAIRSLMGLGATFDPDQHGAPALTREGGHSHNRIVHAGGDQSGAEVQRTLDEAAVAAGVEVLDRAFALDLIVGGRADGQPVACGVRVAELDDEGRCGRVGIITARAVIVATGGYGQVYSSTSNPPAVTGDGLALALRAGLPARDLEFVQFHPTVLWRGADATGQQALISEAVRGEGAILFDGLGRRVMQGVHPQEDLAPRDVVASAISTRMAEAPGGIGDHVFLDATNMGERFYTRFPSITAACRSAGIDPARERIPVAPAAHYVCGGIVADLDGAHRDGEPVRSRRGCLHRRARRQPAGFELVDRGRRRRDPGRAVAGRVVAAAPDVGAGGPGGGRQRSADQPGPTGRHPLRDVAQRRRAAQPAWPAQRSPPAGCTGGSDHGRGHRFRAGPGRRRTS